MTRAAELHALWETLGGPPGEEEADTLRRAREEIEAMRRRLAHAVAYHIKGDPVESDDVVVWRVMDRWRRTTFAVRRHGECLSHAGRWEVEPIPSSRDGGFLLRCRFDTLEEAWEAAEKAPT